MLSHNSLLDYPVDTGEVPSWGLCHLLHLSTFGAFWLSQMEGNHLLVCPRCPSALDLDIGADSVHIKVLPLGSSKTLVQAALVKSSALAMERNYELSWRGLRVLQKSIGQLLAL